MAYQGVKPQLGLNSRIDALAFDGVTTTFPITVAGRQVHTPSAESLIISIDGVIQEPGGAYYLSGSGTSVTFTWAPAATESFFGIVLGEKIDVANAISSLGGNLGGALNWATALTVPAAATVDLGAITSNVVNIIGTTTITSFGSSNNTGAFRVVRFINSTTVNSNASIVLPSGNMVMAAQQIAVFLNTASGVWTLVCTSRAATLDGIETLTNKTINLSNNTLTGTVAQFKAAITDGDFVIDGGIYPINTNTTAVAGRSYYFTGSCELALPASPSVGDQISFANWSGTETCTVNPSGANIMGLAETLTIDSAQVPFTLRYVDATRGWIFF